ncbi:MAG: cytochrome c peroxidase [Bacteroidota bacterium]
MYLSYYQQLFTKAFGSAEITEAKTLEALSQFTAMLISADSKYDKVMRKEANYSFTENEKIGYAIFKQRCNSCHTEPLFTDQSYRNNGLAIKPKDLDRYHFTHNNSDIGKFRVPTLRNIEITGPYMHDGRIYSLKEVLQHYVAGLEINGNLDQLLKADGQIGIPLTATEQLRLIDFLKTLTDVNFINDRRFNNH